MRRTLRTYFFLCIKLQERLIKIQHVPISKSYLKFRNVSELSKPTYNCNFTILWYYNNEAMFWCQLREKIFAFGVDLARITPHSEWIRRLTLSVQIRENLHQKNAPNTQWSGFVVHRTKFVFVSTLRDKFISLI